MKTWRLPEVDTPGGKTSPVVLESQDSARAILIGLEPGQELGDHQVREQAWVVVVDGSVNFSTGDGEIDGPTGTLVVFDPAERHSVRSDDGAKILILLAPWPAPDHYSSET